MDGIYQMNNKIINAHDNILLSDCVIKKIEHENNNIYLYFNEYGIWIKKDSEEYKRERSVQIVFCGCDIDNINIHVVEKKTFFKKTIFIEKDVDFKDFLLNINSGLWKCQIVQEYYCEIGSFMSVMIKEGNKRMRCTFELEYRQ